MSAPVALVTGADKRIGLETARRLAGAGVPGVFHRPQRRARTSRRRDRRRDDRIVSLSLYRHTDDRLRHDVIISAAELVVGAGGLL